MDERTINDLKDYILLHGHEKLSKFKLDNKLREAVIDISKTNKLETNGDFFYYMSKKNMIKKSKNFINHYIKVHEVGYLSDEDLMDVFDNVNISTIYDLVSIFNSSSKSVSAFDLPIDYIFDNLFDGTLNVSAVVTSDRKYFKKILPKLNLYFTGIELPKCVCCITPACYIHEIVHSQLESQKGIIRNYFNVEVLSIFYELLYAYNNNDNVYDIIILTRINSLITAYNNMYKYKNKCSVKEYNSYNYNTDAKYLISILKSIQLFDLYINSNDTIKKEIINSMQNVFDGNNTLEDFLNKYDITYKSSIEKNYVKNIIRSK